ncbi:MAG: type II toxin-antitoxin system RelE/ParE family toxin [Steroidobacteraceae bacterium]
MKVYWTDKARTRLREIEQRIASESPMVASRVVRRILQRSRSIGELPFSGRCVPEFQRDDIREILLRPYRIINRLNVDRIDILTVRHYRELLPEDPRGAY